ncbi:MAG TPA: phenylalanine--tRNA ligase subunit beta, partial [Ilumatobacteraceae bacterium]|nr:phenylalanine--tRNA ligase subunit beta [Ilumatobacteraceae bacterium]
IIGGLDSEVSATTTTVALEIAYFDPVGIAQSVTRHGVRSEASMRFDRGVDPDGMAAAAARFVEILRLTCPDLTVHDGLSDVTTAAFPRPTTVITSAAQINARLGTQLSAQQIIDLIAPLGFVVATSGVGELTIGVPTYRSDCQTYVDIAEEVARQYGYGNVGKTVPKSTLHGTLSPVQQRRRRLRHVLLGLGIDEAMPNPFLADDDLHRAMLDGPVVRIVNSLVADESVLRTSLRPGLLKAIAFNESHRQPQVRLFEVGRVYPPGQGELPDEHEVLCVVLAGSDATAAMAVWREIASAMSLGARVDQTQPPPGLHPTRSATLLVGRDVVGTIGEVHPDVLEAFHVDERVAIIELNLTTLLDKEPKIARWRPTSRYPSSDVDFAFVAPNELTAERVDKAIRQGAGALLVDCRLFDVYRAGDSSSRSLAYRVRLQAADRTLTDTELAEVRRKIIAAVTKLGATLR